MEALVVVVSAVAVVALLGWARAREAVRSGERDAAELRARLDREERASERERAVQDLILRSMRDGILLVGGDGRTAYANPALETHLGGVPAGVGGLFPLALRTAVETAARTRRPETVEVEVNAPPRWLRGHAIPVDPDAVLLVVSDVTEARRLEAVRRDFVANASHELKTPVATIRAAAETLQRALREDPGAAPRFAAQLEHEALRLSRIVEDLLDLSRLEAGSELLERVRLDEVAGEEASRARVAAERGGVRLHVETPSPIVLRGSSRDLALLVRNLLDNAVRHTRPGGSVEVSVTRRDAEAVLRVADTGVGIPERDRERIFERFYRVDRARSRETGGTGLGLSIVKHVAENHGGRVEVTSELGVGSTFEVVLPIEDERA
jgi:two-component system sensor histidine kinase SenX3